MVAGRVGFKSVAYQLRRAARAAGEWRHSKFNRCDGQVRVLGEGEVNVVRGSRGDGVIPDRAGVAVIAFVHHDRDEGRGAGAEVDVGDADAVDEARVEDE